MKQPLLLFLVFVMHVKKCAQERWRYWVLLITPSVFASSSSSPFPTLSVNDGDVVKEVGGRMEMGLKYALIGGGIVMILVGVGVISHRLREDSTNKESGNFIVTLVMAGIAITVGIILLTMGWKAASFSVQS